MLRQWYFFILKRIGNEMKALFVGTYVHVKLEFWGALILPWEMKSQEESARKRLKPTLGRLKMQTTGYGGWGGAAFKICDWGHILSFPTEFPFWSPWLGRTKEKVWEIHTLCSPNTFSMIIAMSGPVLLKFIFESYQNLSFTWIQDQNDNL